MPLIRIEAAAGRSQEEIKALLDAAHRAVLSAFKVPERDRYQIYQEHPQSRDPINPTSRWRHPSAYGVISQFAAVRPYRLRSKLRGSATVWASGTDC